MNRRERTAVYLVFISVALISRNCNFNCQCCQPHMEEELQICAYCRYSPPKRRKQACKIFEISLPFFCSLPPTSHEQDVPKRPNAVCRDRWQHGYTWNFYTSCSEWHVSSHGQRFLSVHMDSAHNTVIVSNTSLIIKAIFCNPEK